MLPLSPSPSETKQLLDKPKTPDPGVEPSPFHTTTTPEPKKRKGLADEEEESNATKRCCHKRATVSLSVDIPGSRFQEEQRQTEIECILLDDDDSESRSEASFRLALSSDEEGEEPNPNPNPKKIHRPDTSEPDTISSRESISAVSVVCPTASPENIIKKTKKKERKSGTIAKYGRI